MKLYFQQDSLYLYRNYLFLQQSATFYLKFAFQFSRSSLIIRILVFDIWNFYQYSLKTLATLQFLRFQMENLNNSPVLILRQNNRQFRQKQKALKRRIRNKSKLREQIYSDHNIFQSSINLYRNMTAQNIIWEKNYNYKCVINQVKEENSGLKARIWNVEKENRKMERQIQSWNLSEFAAVPQTTKKPYVDMATVQKVLADQDYSIVSLKMQIFQLQRILQERSVQYESIIERNKNTQKLLSLLNHEIVDKKIQICGILGSDKTTRPEKGYKQRMSSNILRHNHTLDLIAKNVQIKKKSKHNIENDLSSIAHQCNLQKNITYQQIERLCQQIRTMRAEEDGGINIERQKLKIAEKNTLDYKCFVQNQMGSFIKQKMPLKYEIQMIKEALSEMEVPGEQIKKKSVSID